MDEHTAAVWRLCRALAPPGDAEDCFQETFLSALRAYPGLRDARNLRAWVLTIAQRKAVDAHRSRARRARPTDAPPETPLAARDGFDPAVWEAVRGLPPKQ